MLANLFGGKLYCWEHTGDTASLGGISFLVNSRQFWPELSKPHYFS